MLVVVVVVVVALAVGSGAVDSDAIGIAKAGVSIAGGARFASIEDVGDDAVEDADGGGNIAGEELAISAAGKRVCA